MDMPFTSPEERESYLASGIWGHATLFERFSVHAARTPEKLALVDGSRSYRYGELARLIDTLATYFLKIGVSPGEVVAVQLPDGAELPIAHFALNRIGALCMPIHASWRETEVAHLLRQGQAVAALVPEQYQDFDYRTMIESFRDTLPAYRTTYSLGKAGPQSSSFDAMLGATEIDLEALARCRPHPDAPAALMLSSGTTALPKISVFSSNNIHALVQAFAHAVQFVQDDVAAALAPMGTGAIGYCYPVLTPLLNGGTTVILDKWSPKAAVDLIQAHRCTYATGVPAQLTQMLPTLEFHSPDEFDGFRAFNNAGAPLPADVGRQIEALMNCVVLGLYGATDGGTVASTNMNDPQDKRLHTVGRPFPGRQVKLVDATGAIAPPGEPGEIYWRSADKSYGYLNDPEATQATFSSDRFYKSGDLGRFDAEGYLLIIGRVKDMILRGGRNLSPRLIEEALIEHSSILEVAVAAMPDPILGERACAFVVLRQGCTLDFEQAIAFLKERKVSRWQLPEWLEVMEDLPRSAGGKIAKNQLTQFITRKLAEAASKGVPSPIEGGTQAMADPVNAPMAPGG